ncbi:MAG TPA: hypothetical protein VF719_05965, partial [Abditibacteriaceae bacterium]
MSDSSAVIQTPVTPLYAAHSPALDVAVINPEASGVTLGGVTKSARNVRRNTEPALIRWLLTTIALAFLALFLVVPVAVVFIEAFKEGWDVYLASIKEPDALAAIKL